MNTQRPAMIGDLCPDCGARLGVLNTFIEGNSRIRYLGCHDCDFRPSENKQVIPLEFAPPQRKRFARKENWRRKSA